MARTPFEKTKYRLLVPMAIVTVVLGMASAATSYVYQIDRSQETMRSSAAVLAESLTATWDFMQINQDRINHDSQGNYDFKGLHCSIAGLSVGSLLSSRTDYTIRYTSDAPRNLGHSSDDFETEALAHFRADPDLAEWTRVEEFRGEVSHRYAVPLLMGEGCSECHGGPAGELDVTGYAREGYEDGYVIGVLSITQPTAPFVGIVEGNLRREILQFGLLLAAALVVMYLFASKWVTKPLEKLGAAATSIGQGNLSVDLSPIEARGEIEDLRRCFSQMTDELRDLYGSLESKVVERTAQISTMNEALEAKTRELELANARLAEESRGKTEFLSMVGHELRTPLTSILAFTELLEAAGVGEGDERVANTLHEIQTNGLVLLGKINTLLDTARFEAGKAELDLDVVDMVDVVNAVEGILEPLARRNGVTLLTNIASDVPLIEADGEKVMCAVENLVGNAIKFTPEGGSVFVDVYLKKRTNQLVVRVCDDGVGIEEARLPFIFDKFVQGDSSASRKYNGSGLGLSLAKGMVELHGGSISVKSEVGKGSIFTVVLPVKAAQTGV